MWRPEQNLNTLRSINLEDVRRIYAFLLDISGDDDRITKLKHQVTKMMPHFDISCKKVQTMENFMSHPSQKRLPILAQF